MSIKAFHLIFIAAAALFFAGFGVWAVFFDSAQEAGSAVESFGIAGFITSAALIVYGIRFYRKAKSIIV